MKHKTSAGFAIIAVLFFSVVGAAAIFEPSGPPGQSYQVDIKAAQSWLGTLPSGTRVLDVGQGFDNASHLLVISTENYGSRELNRSLLANSSGVVVFWAPYLGSSPEVASYAAYDVNASVLVVTSGAGWSAFNSTSLYGASVLFSNGAVRAFCVSQPCAG